MALQNLDWENGIHSFKGYVLENSSRWLAAVPVYNEVQSVHQILDRIIEYADHVLVIDDGSDDGTAEILNERQLAGDIVVKRHAKNRGYGAALKTAFRHTIEQGFEGVVTLDCDGQHQPKRIPQFIEAAENADIVSGSRYLRVYEGDDAPPEDRLFVNRCITAEINHRLGLCLTDSFCGFKAYRTEALKTFDIVDDGYAMPLELWVQVAAAGLNVIEIPVPRIYLDLTRTFGNGLDESKTRLNHYRTVIDRAISQVELEGHAFPPRDESLCVGAGS